MNIKAIQPVHCHDWGITHACLSVCTGLQSARFTVTLRVPSADRFVTAGLVRPLVSRRLLPLVRRVPFLARRITPRLVASYLRELRQGDVAYLWPGLPLPVYAGVKQRGAVLLMERINCHTATARRILDAEYLRLGRAPEHGIETQHVTDERAELALADLVFAPSPAVVASLVENGVPADRVLRTSYGWEPRRFLGTHRALAACAGATVLFVGRVCIRKGAHLLLDYWERAGIAGRLVLDGQLSQDVAAGAARTLARGDVLYRRPGYRDDIAAVYGSADFFAFPTLEEGSPLAVYEALACGLPLLISPMGAGDIVRDGIEGLVRDPHDADAWIAGLRQLAGDDALRARMAAACRARAADYTWSEVGMRRRQLLGCALDR
jgi:glycosyltransferase involved in cell wall biosynthesis